MSVVIVSFNSEALLKTCLDSLRWAAGDPEYEIIVVDNGSTDGSVLMLRSNYPHVHVICNNENLLFSKAVNQGIKLAAGKYVLLANSDTEVAKDAVEKLVEFLDKTPEAAAVGPKVLNPDGTIQSRGHPFLTFRTAFELLAGLQHIPMPGRVGEFLRKDLSLKGDQPAPTGWISGCCLLVRRSIFEQVGGLHEELQFYGEEVEWCWRVRQAGLSVWVFPMAEIVHLGGGSTTDEFKVRLEDTQRKAAKFIFLTHLTTGLVRTFVVLFVLDLALCAKWAAFQIVGAHKRTALWNRVRYELALLWLLGRCVVSRQLRDEVFALAKTHPADSLQDAKG